MFDTLTLITYVPEHEGAYNDQLDGIGVMLKFTDRRMNTHACCRYAI